MMAIASEDLQNSTQRESVLRTTESIDSDNSMEVPESASQENHLPNSEWTDTVLEENVYYLGSPASMGHEPSRQYGQTSASEQDMLDCKSNSLQSLRYVLCLQLLPMGTIVVISYG